MTNLHPRLGGADGCKQLWNRLQLDFNETDLHHAFVIGPDAPNPPLVPKEPPRRETEAGVDRWSETQGRLIDRVEERSLLCGVRAMTFDRDRDRELREQRAKSANQELDLALQAAADAEEAEEQIEDSGFESFLDRFPAAVRGRRSPD